MYRRTRLSSTRLVAVGGLVAASLAAGAGVAAGTAAPDDGRREIVRTASDDTTQIVMVRAPEVEDRNEVIELGLDVTEHATERGIEVVLHDDKDAQALRDAGFTWTVTVDDLEALTETNRKADRAYDARVTRSALPSGRTAYRTYDDYLRDMNRLARLYPTLTKPLTLANPTVLGERIRGLEISVDATDVRDGKPVFLLMGAHHAREWPSAEHTMEFGFDLLQSYYSSDRAVRDRARRVLSESRVIVVPVVNVDGFKISRGAEPLGDLSQFDYEMKRKNCSISAATPAQYLGGTCDDNPAGRLRGTDLNRNYPGFWGGGGASPVWSSDTFRGDAPGSEPETDSVRQLISERAVTVMISNHTYSNLVLRPPAIAATGLAPDEPELKALGDAMAAQNSYTSQASYQLYDTSGSTEDWSYWITGGLGYTFEIGDEGFHPAYEEAVVGEYLGEAPADSAGLGGNQEAYWVAAEAAADDALHSRISGKAPAGRTITVSKSVVSPTSPVIQVDGTLGEPILYADTLVNEYATDRGGRFVIDVNPSTRPLVAGRYGRLPQAPPQAPLTLVNPPGVPAVGSSELTTFEVQGLPQADNGFAVVSISWPSTDPEDFDWDFTLLGPDGTPVGSGATLANPEVIRIPDPQPGTYTLVADNYAGGSAANDWSGQVTFESPTPPIETGVKESWIVSCADRRGRVFGTREVVVDRGELAGVGDICRPGSAKR
ncbi:M14 family zinc carboxypeptidase [Nocardioides sp. S-58]|uniref:M14 family zinc carboxypeptidase n=1 Tax=Nocardioides renjunii TaxID=3095075 RepID=A0ABU5K725_9ACTN|nr:M14 family zinc carboxypeptidase [Nocardioides sp. S-58]MDZ5660682.1 M14 family zinc carboxypeptidase [Nocardioides sp. S-58]